MILAGEQRLALNHLGEDAAGAPDVDLDVVFLPRQHDLRSAVVSSRHVARHLGILQAREAEIADLQIAVLVDEDVAGLEVAVDDTGGVDVFQSPHDLVQEVLDELRLEWPRSKESVEICAEELGDEVDVLQRRDEDIAQRNNILVPEMLQELKLAVGSLCQDGRAEGLHNFLHRDILVRELVPRRAHKTKSTHANRLEIRISGCDLKGRPEYLRSYEFRHFVCFWQTREVRLYFQYVSLFLSRAVPDRNWVAASFGNRREFRLYARKTPGEFSVQLELVVGVSVESPRIVSLSGARRGFEGSNKMRRRRNWGG